MQLKLSQSWIYHENPTRLVSIKCPFSSWGSKYKDILPDRSDQISALPFAVLFSTWTTQLQQPPKSLQLTNQGSACLTNCLLPRVLIPASLTHLWALRHILSSATYCPCYWHLAHLLFTTTHCLSYWPLLPVASLTVSATSKVLPGWHRWRGWVLCPQSISTHAGTLAVCKSNNILNDILDEKKCPVHTKLIPTL